MPPPKKTQPEPFPEDENPDYDGVPGEDEEDEEEPQAAPAPKAKKATAKEDPIKTEAGNEVDTESAILRVFSPKQSASGHINHRMIQVEVSQSIGLNPNPKGEPTQWVGAKTIISETREAMTYDQAMTAWKVAANDAVTQVAATLGLETTETDDGTVRFKSVRQVSTGTKPGSGGAAAGGAKGGNARTGTGGGGGRSSGGSRGGGNRGGGGGGGGQFRNPSHYSREDADALWTLYSENEDAFWNNLDGNYPNIKPKREAFEALEMDTPDEIKPLYLKSAPQWAKDDYGFEG